MALPRQGRDGRARARYRRVPPDLKADSQATAPPISLFIFSFLTDLAYNWFKGSIRSFIRPELNAQYFLSKNGKLYISEVQASDQATYHCMALMVPQQGQVLAANQAPSRISMPIKVTVGGENANTYGPDIQDKFPQFFPTVPMVGERIEIECLAYG
ncbi:contactin, partial [Plakobranchus ocellatus]